MPETDAQQTHSAPPDAAEPGLPTPSEEARVRADGFQRRADGPSISGPGLLPDVFEELNATIEELRVAEEEMRVQNEELLLTHRRVEAERYRYQDLFESAPDGYLITDTNGRIQEANRAAAALLGIAPRFLKGRGLETSVVPEDLAAYYAALKALTASPAPQEERALRLRRRHVGVFHAAVTAALVVEMGSQPATLRWLIRDVSERRRAEDERLARAQAEWEAQIAGGRERRVAALPRLLPHGVPADAFPRLSVEAFPQTITGKAEAGGVFFDAFAQDGSRVALVVGDAGGGPDAAAWAAEIKYALLVFLRRAPGPAPALAGLGDFVCEAARLGDFGGDRPVTLALATIDPESGETTLATAGGASVLVLRAGGGAETFRAGNPALGVQPGTPYTDAQTTLSVADTLIVAHGLAASARDAPTRLTERTEAADGAGTLRGLGRAVLDAARAEAGGALGGDACLLLARRRE